MECQSFENSHLFNKERKETRCLTQNMTMSEVKTVTSKTMYEMERNPKYDLCINTAYRMVACHIETLRSSNSSTVHITQLGCSCFPSNLYTETTSSLFRAVIVPGLNKYLDTCRLSGNILQALHITREDDGINFSYRRQYEDDGSRKEAILCVSESVALEDCIVFLETLGPNIILVGIDEETLAVLIDKLKMYDKHRFKQTVKGFTYWRRILKHMGVANYKELVLEDYHRLTFPGHCSDVDNCLRVAEILSSCITELARKHHMETKLSAGRFVTVSCISTNLHPRHQNRKVMMEEDREVLEIYSSFTPEFAVSITVTPLEQIYLDTDNMKLTQSLKN